MAACSDVMPVVERTVAAGHGGVQPSADGAHLLPRRTVRGALTTSQVTQLTSDSRFGSASPWPSCESHPPTSRPSEMHAAPCSSSCLCNLLSSNRAASSICSFPLLQSTYPPPSHRAPRLVPLPAFAPVPSRHPIDPRSNLTQPPCYSKQTLPARPPNASPRRAPNTLHCLPPRPCLPELVSSFRLRPPTLVRSFYINSLDSTCSACPRHVHIRNRVHAPTTVRHIDPAALALQAGVLSRS